MKPAIITLANVTTVVFLMIKCLQFLWVMEDMNTGLLIPATLPLAITVFIIVVTMLDMDIDLKRPATLSLAVVDFIILVLVLEVQLGIKRPAIIPITILEQELVLTIEVDIGIIPATLPPIDQVAVANVLVDKFLLVLLAKLFIVMRYYDIAAMAPRGVISVAMMVKGGEIEVVMMVTRGVI